MSLNKNWIGLTSLRLKKTQGLARFHHTQGVLRLALKLAQAHGLDEFKTAQAALLHDCVKGMPMSWLKARLNRAGADAFERSVSALWHAPVGAWFARQSFGLKNREVLTAIRWHSSGRPGMTALQQVLFVADYAETGRHFRGLTALRDLAMRDLAAATHETLKQKTLYLLERGQAIHPVAIRAWNYFLKL